MELMATTLAWLTDNTGLVTAIVGLITICAIYLSPIVALRLQKKLENDDERKERKINIFKTLMATRAEPLSFEHVKALNMIDIEFYGDNGITDAWNSYRDHLNSYPQNPDQTYQKIWDDKTADYLTGLLFEMSKLLKFDFNKVLLKKGAYVPLAHGILNIEQTIIRQNLIGLLSGKTSLKVELIHKPKNL